MFRYKRGINLPYEKQGLIYFVCINYDDMPDDIQQKINNLCFEVAGEDYPELMDVLKGKGILNTALKYNTYEGKLCNYRKKFYESWFN